MVKNVSVKPHKKKSKSGKVIRVKGYSRSKPKKKISIKTLPKTKKIRIIINWLDEETGDYDIRDVSERTMTKEQFHKYISGYGRGRGLSIDYDWDDGIIETWEE